MPPENNPIALFPPLSDPAEPAYASTPAVSGLPRVLLLGDSISIGYTLPVRELLANTATVHRPAANCGQTAFALRHLADWLGTETWDVIHFNFGLHDLKYLDQAGNYVGPAQGRLVAPIEVYRRNLDALVTRLAATGATLIFATTTPVPAGAAGRLAGSERPYNQCALEVMRAHGVAVTDLWSIAARRQSEILRPNDVHFTTEGYQELAALVAQGIKTALSAPGGRR